MRCPKCDKSLEYKMFITESGQFRKTCQNCRHKKCQPKARSFMIIFKLEEPVFQVDPLTGINLNQTPISVSILRLKQVIKSLNAKEIYLFDHSDEFQALIIFNNTRSISAIRKLLPFSFVIFNTEECTNSMKIVRKTLGVVNYADDDIKEIPYFTAKTKIELEREKRLLIRENKIQLQNLKESFIDDNLSSFHPLLTLEDHEFQLLEDDQRESFWDFMRSNFDKNIEEDFTKIKNEIHKRKSKEIQKDISKAQKEFKETQLKTTNKKADKKDDNKDEKTKINDKLTEEEYINASINVKNRSMGASMYYYTSRGYDEEKLRSYL